MDLSFTPMQAAHLEHALGLSVAESWPHRIEDWALVLQISNGFVALADGKLVATAMVTPFSQVAMANMIIVDGAIRGQGIGRKIVQQAMATVDPVSWRLVATTDGLPLYEKLGFNVVGEISQYQGGVGKVASIGDAVWASDDDLPSIIKLDSLALQMDRRSLYEALAKRARFAVLRDQSGITGFAAIRDFGRGKVIGPVVAQGADESKSLISFVMSEYRDQFLRRDTDIDSGLGPWLEACGLIKAGGGRVMHMGAPIAPSNNSLICFALTSQALG